MQKEEQPREPKKDTLNPSLKLEVFDKPEPKQTQQQNFMAQYVPYNRSFLPDSSMYKKFGPGFGVNLGPSLEMPVYNNYNIQMPGPTGSHVTMNRIYETILPKEFTEYTKSTLGERLNIIDYVRQILIKSYDGEDIGIDNSAQRNILQYIKFLEINPNQYNTISSNPYRGLPANMLLQRACFPVKFDNYNSMVVCSRNSIGLNIRLYALTFAEFLSYSYRLDIYLKYDVWREIFYYEFIRENIIKPKICQNFVTMFTYFTNTNQNIDFPKLKLLNDKKTQSDMLAEEYTKFKQLHIGLNGSIYSCATDPAVSSGMEMLPDEKDKTLKEYSKKLVVVVTEAPSENIYQWSCRKYERNGIVDKMITHGHHSDKVWFNVLFQLTAAMYVMQCKKIFIRDMTLQDNVYIMDLRINTKQAGYWKYIIEDITYYVPNMGCVVLIDTNYKDISAGNSMSTNNSRKHKIYIDKFLDNYGMTSINIHDNIFECYKQMVNVNNFSLSNTHNNMVKPGPRVIQLLQDITAFSSPSKNINEYIKKFFTGYLNNRIGTPVKRDTEISNLKSIPSSSNSLSKGKIVAKINDEKEFEWVQIEDIKDDMVKFRTKAQGSVADDFLSYKSYTDNDIRIENLRDVLSGSNIQQDMLDPLVKITEEELLETYIIKQ